MPSSAGAEHTIHSRIGEIKQRDQPIVVDFEKPSGEHQVLTFESYVTRADLKAALRSEGLAMLLGVRETSDSELDKLFDRLDADKDNSITRGEWQEFVAVRIKALLELYDQIGHTKKMGIVYAGNTITDVSAGLSAERQGVSVGWKIITVCPDFRLWMFAKDRHVC